MPTDSDFVHFATERMRMLDLFVHSAV